MVGALSIHVSDATDRGDLERKRSFRELGRQTNYLVNLPIQRLDRGFAGLDMAAWEGLPSRLLVVNCQNFWAVGSKGRNMTQKYSRGSSAQGWGGGICVACWARQAGQGGP